MKTYQHFTEELNANFEDTLVEGRTLKMIAGGLRMKQAGYRNRIKATDDINEKIDLLSEQMVSQSTLILTLLLSLSSDINKGNR